jgi:hypothetical protein
MNEPWVRELNNLRADVMRSEDRLLGQLAKQDIIAEKWRTRSEAENENRHIENTKRLDQLERYLNQGVGAASAVRYMWYVITGMVSLAAGYFGHHLAAK